MLAELCLARRSVNQELSKVQVKLPAVIPVHISSRRAVNTRAHLNVLQAG